MPTSSSSRFPSAHPVPADKLADFTARAAPLLARLELIANGEVAQLE